MIDLYINRKLKWWGYLLDDGTMHTRRYFDDKDLAEAVESGSVEFIVEPFDSFSKANAEKTVELECMKHLASLK
jgi:hypothetical protein